ncbi:CocE/NonD family hydrolase [Halobellus rufus]|uniref:CocE/NonD family hydrolase n=1 Tax=Halobellus rufus TaxID=1448860 RepID=UPI000AD44F68|nr:CocE/NonD family hydrolase [Halobellus rufus]
MLKAGGIGIGAALVPSLGSSTVVASNQGDPTDPDVEQVWEYREDGVAHSIVSETDVAIPMRDDLELAANIHRPEDSGEYPVLLAFTAYGKDIYWTEGEDEFGIPWPGDGVAYEPWGPPITGACTFEAENPEYWVPSGYVVIVVDPRGFGRSPGTFTGFSSWGRDMYDAIEWAAQQDWSNGNVGLSGVSILSTSQYYAANLNPPHLEAICPWEGGPFTDYPTHEGVGPQTSPDITGTFPAPSNPAWGAPEAENPPEPMEKKEDEYFAGVSTPALVCGTWSSQGVFTRRDMRAFRNISSDQKWLFTHGRGKWATFYQSEAQVFRKMFFDHFLKGTDDRILNVPPVRIETRETLQNWTVSQEEDFPIPRTEYKKLYLDAGDARLGDDPTNSQSSISYDSTEQDSVIFDFTFEEDTSLIGYQSLKLWVTPEDAPDGDLFVTIRKFDTDGEEVKFTGYGAPLQYPVALGWLRLSRRKLNEEKSTIWEPYLDYEAEPREVDPGEMVECHIPIRPSSTHYSEGETLQLEISGTYLGKEDLEVQYPAREPGQTPYAWETINEGEHTIHTGGNTPSHLVIPEIPSDTPGRGHTTDNPGRGPPENPGNN